MNVSEELYRSGASLTVREVYSRKGKRAVVLDPHRRAKALILRLLEEGKRPRQIARALDLPLSTVCALGLAAVRAKKDWPKSNFRLAAVGLNP